VSDVFNCVEITGSAAGKVAFYGSGAGSIPTASAVAADMMDAAANLNRTLYKDLWRSESDSVSGSEVMNCRRFVRAEGALESAVEIFGGAVKVNGVSGAAFVVPEMCGSEFNKRLARFKEETLVYAAYSILD
jgi:homoserine dehydrogenase